jgi:hypothetical protein
MSGQTAPTPNNFFLPGYEISRAVIQSEIKYFCGPEAIARAYTFQVWPPPSSPFQKGKK